MALPAGTYEIAWKLRGCRPSHPATVSQLFKPSRTVQRIHAPALLYSAASLSRYCGILLNAYSLVKTKFSSIFARTSSMWVQ